MITKDEMSIISAYTGILMGDFSDMHEYIERIMDRPVFTHEMGNKDICQQIKENAKPDFLKLANSNTTEKNI